MSSSRIPCRSSTACRPKSCYRFNKLWKTIFFSIVLPIRSSIFFPPQALELEASLICLLIYRDSPSVNHCLPLSCHAEDRGYGQELFDEIPEKGNHLILQAIFLLVSTAKLYSCPITRNMRF